MRNPYFNILLDVCDKEEALQNCHKILTGNSAKTLFFVNAHCFNLAQQTSSYIQALNKSDLIYNDGIGMKLGSFLAGVKLKDNLNGTDLIPQIISHGVSLDKKVYIVGGSDGVAQRAKFIIDNKYRKEVVAGVSNGFFSDEEEKQLIAHINSTKAEILVVGMGVPRQELWIDKVKKDLTHIKLCIAGGAIIDFISGEKKRAPLLLRKIHLEWMFRLYLEPKRMWKRYIIGNIVFFMYVIGFSWKRLQNKNLQQVS